LPTFLGGKADCDLFKNIGPWNPYGLEFYGSLEDIRKKNELI
jgi:hypothetical protein